MILYFSATGNNKYIAEKIAMELDDHAVSIEKFNTEKIRLRNGESFGIVVPTYFLELPANVKEFLQSMVFECGGDNYVFGVVTYGSIPGASGINLKKLLRAKGIRIDALYSIITPDTWTIVYDLSDKEKVVETLKVTQDQLKKVIGRIRAKEKGDFITWRLPYLITSIYDPLYNRARNTSHFKVEGGCIGCGLCERNCPVKAIKIENNKPIWIKEKCIACLRCLHNCPTFSIQYGNKTKAHGQYRTTMYLEDEVTDEVRSK